MDWMLVVKVVVAVVLIVVAVGIVWAIEDSAKSYVNDPTM